MNSASEKFRNQYRIASSRLDSWDYGWSAAYFVTICTKERIHYFGKIDDDVMQLSAIGNIVEFEWGKTSDMRSDMNLRMGQYVIMPNHFHAIIIIGKNEYNALNDGIRDYENGKGNNDKICDDGNGNGNRRGRGKEDARHCVSTETTTAINKFGAQSKNLASLIRGFKTGVSVNVRKINPNFAWQTRFHDHIIRNEQSYNRITKYIEENPLHWQKDQHYNS